MGTSVGSGVGSSVGSGVSFSAVFPVGSGVTRTMDGDVGAGVSASTEGLVFDAQDPPFLKLFPVPRELKIKAAAMPSTMAPAAIELKRIIFFFLLIIHVLSDLCIYHTPFSFKMLWKKGFVTNILQKQRIWYSAYRKTGVKAE